MFALFGFVTHNILCELNMNGKAVIKVLRKHGFECIRINGSHHIMWDGKNCPFPVPVHGARDLGLGLLRQIEKQSGVKLK